jgi:hypothetical protein
MRAKNDWHTDSVQYDFFTRFSRLEGMRSTQTAYSGAKPVETVSGAYRKPALFGRGWARNEQQGVFINSTAPRGPQDIAASF